MTLDQEVEMFSDIASAIGRLSGEIDTARTQRDQDKLELLRYDLYLFARNTNQRLVPNRKPRCRVNRNSRRITQELGFYEDTPV